MRFAYLCALMAVLGLSLMYVAASSLEPRLVDISEINGDYVGRVVEAVGYVEGVYRTENLFFTLSDGTGKIRVAVFSALTKDPRLSVSNGDKIRVVGTVDEYKGDIELVPRKVSDIKPLGV